MVKLWPLVISAHCLLLSILLLLGADLLPAVGCMDYIANNEIWRSSDYRAVQCNCPCHHVINLQGECLQCHHFGRLDRGLMSINQILR